MESLFSFKTMILGTSPFIYIYENSVMTAIQDVVLCFTMNYRDVSRL